MIQWGHARHVVVHGLLCGALCFAFFSVLAADDKPLSFDFTRSMPGQWVQLEHFRLHVDCQGSGPVSVLFEPGLGGSAFEWQPIQQALSSTARVCVYDRAGYGWSDPSPHPRFADQLASEADQMLTALNINGPLILVGHSFGGFVTRLLAKRRADDMLGLVLLDSSHEDQLATLEQLDGKSRMPRDSSFVVSQVDIPQALPRDIQRKIAAFGRMRKTYAALHAEMSYFRRSADQVRAARRVFDFPVVVVQRGRDLYANTQQGNSKTAIWQTLQEDMVSLSSVGRMVTAADSGHHIHADQPQLIISIIEQLIATGERADSPPRK